MVDEVGVVDEVGMVDEVGVVDEVGMVDKVGVVDEVVAVVPSGLGSVLPMAKASIAWSKFVLKVGLMEYRATIPCGL